MGYAVKGVFLVLGILSLGWSADKGKDALEEGAELAKWAAVLTALYLAYSIHKSGGFLK